MHGTFPNQNEELRYHGRLQGSGLSGTSGTRAKARQAALDKLKAKPAPDPEVVAQRLAAQAAKEAAQAAKRAEKLAEREQAKLDAEARIAAAEAEAENAALQEVETEAEKKLKRDARYAARKKRK